MLKFCISSRVMFIDPEAIEVVREEFSVPAVGLLKANLSFVVLFVQKFLS